MLFLLVCAVLAEMMQQGAVVQAFATMFSKAERLYGEVQQNIVEELIINIFRIGTLAMALYLYAYRTGEFRFTTYLLIAALVLGVDMLKLVLSVWINYTFRISKRFAQISAHYNNLWTVICCGIYTAVVVLLNVDNRMAVQWTLFGLTVAAIVLIAIKWIRIFCTNIRSLLYILLYILTLEVLPLLLMIAGTDYIVD